MRASTCDTVSRRCGRLGCCWFAFPLVPALGSPGSAADRSALFASFAATTAGSDFPCSFIIGYRFSLPDADQKRDCPGRTRDLPSSDAILLRVICSSTPAGRAWPRLAALSVLRSTLCTVSAPATYPLRGSITHPTQPLCMLRGRRRRRLTQHSLPGCLLGITWVGLSPTDRASFAWRLRRDGPQGDICSAANFVPEPKPGLSAVYLENDFSPLMRRAADHLLTGAHILQRQTAPYFQAHLSTAKQLRNSVQPFRTDFSVEKY